MSFSQIILTPFVWVLMFFYNFFNSYGFALLFFALVVKVILFPLSLKGKRSMIQMNMLSGKMQKLQKQFGKDQARYNEEVQKLYDKEHVNPMGGCLWSMLPMLFLFPLYAIIRQPLTYMMGLTGDQITAIAGAVDWNAVAVKMGWVTQKALESAGNVYQNAGYNQLYLASLITPENLEAVKAVVGSTTKEVFSINFDFLGVNLSQVPHLKFWENASMFQGVGLFLIPVISAATGLLFSIISMKTNAMNQQTPQAGGMSNKMMMLMSPVMSLWIGFAMPAALGVYWVYNNLLGMLQEVITSRMLKKDYAKAAAEQKRREAEEKEEEKRLRREKAEAHARQAEEAKKNKGKKKKVEDEEAEKIPASVKEASRSGMRQYARGRAYDPDRFGDVTGYFEQAGKTPDVAENREDKKLEDKADTREAVTLLEEADQEIVDSLKGEAALPEADDAPEEEPEASESPDEDEKPKD